MDTLSPSRQERNLLPEWLNSHAANRNSAYLGHEFVTHDQRTSDARELVFDDLDARERTIFLRCGFRAPQTA